MNFWNFPKYASLCHHGVKCILCYYNCLNLPSFSLICALLNFHVVFNFVFLQPEKEKIETNVQEKKGSVAKAFGDDSDVSLIVALLDIYLKYFNCPI